MKKFLFVTATIFLFANVAYSQCEPISTFPWTEGFENNGENLPLCWEQEANYWPWNWNVVQGAVGTPATAHGGNAKAQIYHAPCAYLPVFYTKLITPVFDLTAVNEPELTFWHTQTETSKRLEVYYKNAPNGEWISLNSSFGCEVTIPDWQEERIMLPEKSDYYQIAFCGIYLGGGGADIQLDDISITGNDENPECPKAKNFNAILEDQNVILSWVKPNETSCFMLLFNGEFLQGNITATTFTHENVPEGTHTYGIVDIADNCMTEIVETTIQILSITETEISKISVYPNPTTGILKIESRELKIEDVVIYDVFGKIQKMENWKTANTIDISHLPEGVYFLKICTEKGEVMKKVLKE